MECCIFLDALEKMVDHLYAKSTIIGGKRQAASGNWSAGAILHPHFFSSSMQE
jgi:hypothetical protein